MKTNITQDEILKNSGKKRYTLTLSKESTLSVSSRKENEGKRKKYNTWFYVGFVGEIGYVVLVPMVGGALLGEYIDKVRSTYPTATHILFYVGLFISVVGFTRIVQELMNRKN